MRRFGLQTLGCSFILVIVSCVGLVPELTPLGPAPEKEKPDHFWNIAPNTAEDEPLEKNLNIGIPVEENTTIAILPAQIIGYDVDWSRGIESMFSAELINRGHSIVNISDLDEILRVQELTLSGIVNNDEKRIEIGQILSAENVLAVSAIWNGQYHLVDVRLTDVQTARVVFQRCYTTRKSTMDIIESGIRIIVTHMHGEEARSAVWESTAMYQRDSVGQSIVERSRSLKTFKLCLVYAGIGGHYLDSEYLNSTQKKLRTYTENVQADVLRTFEQLYSSSEFVSVYHLGSYDSYPSGEIVRSISTGIDYSVIRALLKQPATYIAFFGNTEEMANAMNYVSLTNKERFYWAKRY